MKKVLIVLAGFVTTSTLAASVRWGADPGQTEPTVQDEVELTVSEPIPLDEPAYEAAPEPEVELPVFGGYEADWHQANDELIVRVVGEFNAEMGWDARHEDYLDPALVKAWALQESGGHRGIFTGGDMMQMNNAGDWAAEKEWFGVRRGQRLTPEESLRAALRWAYYKGEETRPMRDALASRGWYRTVRGGETLPGYESRFTDWDRALDRYNGGGVPDYGGDIARRMARSQPPRRTG